MSLAVGSRPALVRARTAVSLLFLLYGVILGTWTARIPAVKHRLGLTDGSLSIALLAFAAGAILGMQVSGRLVDWYGSRRVMVPAALADAALLIPPGYLTGLAGLAAGLLAFGAVHGTLNVAMNVYAVEVQRAWRRPILSSCHAVYSIGGFLGAAAGGLLARTGLSAGVSFVAVAVAVVPVAAVSRWLAPPPGAAPGSVEPDGGTPPGRPAVFFLGLLVFCCLVGEGAAADWSAVYLHDNLGTSAGFAAAGYAAFAVMMMLGRLAGDRLAAALGPVWLVRCCGLLAAAGLAGALLVNRPLAGVAGFGCLGAGLSCIAPQVFSAAGSRNPAFAGQAIARVAGLGFLGFVVGPVLIGAAARPVGLPHALLIPAALALFVAGSATAVRPPGPAD